MDAFKNKFFKILLNQWILWVGLMYWFFACNVDDTGEKPIEIPSEVTLLTPSDNSFCVGSEQDNGIAVQFEWSSAEFASKYEITLFDASGGILHFKETTQTSTSLIVPKGAALTWYVKAINESGESISETFSTTSPGETVPNTLPLINAVVFDTHNNRIIARVQDSEGDALYYDALSAENSFFENAIIYAENKSVEGSDGSPSEHQIEIDKIQWRGTFWFQLTLRDAQGNQIVAVKSQVFLAD